MNQERHPRVVPGVIEPGLILREDQLKIMLDVKDWRSLRKHLDAIGVQGTRVGNFNWYSTEQVVKGFERFLNGE